MVAEAKNAKALRFDDSRARSVRLLRLIGKMLSAVEFDYQLRRVADEICDVVLDWDLTAKTGAVQPMIAQLRPEDALCVCRIPSERACVGAQLGRHFPGW